MFIWPFNSLYSMFVIFILPLLIVYVSNPHPLWAMHFLTAYYLGFFGTWITLLSYTEIKRNSGYLWFTNIEEAANPEAVIKGYVKWIETQKKDPDRILIKFMVSPKEKENQLQMLFDRWFNIDFLDDTNTHIEADAFDLEWKKITDILEWQKITNTLEANTNNLSEIETAVVDNLDWSSLIEICLTSIC